MGRFLFVLALALLIALLISNITQIIKSRRINKTNALTITNAGLEAELLKLLQTTFPSYSIYQKLQLNEFISLSELDSKFTEGIDLTSIEKQRCDFILIDQNKKVRAVIDWAKTVQPTIATQQKIKLLHAADIKVVFCEPQQLPTQQQLLTQLQL